MSMGNLGKTILVVEDSPTQAVQLEHLLLEHGFEVEVAQNGLLALEAMRRRKPDIVISDIVMPEMNGYDLCRAVRKDASLKDASVMLLTSLSETEEVLRALECGADYFITKPYEKEFLVARIREILAQREEGADRGGRGGQEIVYNRESYAIPTDRRRILDLLLSTYESTIRKNTELRRAHDDLRSMNDRLERAVTERTRALGAETFERQRAEEALAELKRAEEVLVRRHEELSVLYQVTTVISVSKDLRDLCTGVLASISELGLFRSRCEGTIFLAEGGKLIAHDRDDAREGEVSHRSSECEDSLCFLAARTGEPILSKDPESDGRERAAAGERHGHVVVPLSTQSRLVGVLSLRTEPDDLPEADDSMMELFRSLGNQIAVGVENARLYEQTRHGSLHDPLTGLPNRRHLEIFFEKTFAQAVRGTPLSVLLFDIDRFKRYNDTYGHAAGDEVLVKVGQVASDQLRDTDLIARYGGEEFLAVCQGLTQEQSCKVAERIRSAIEEKTDVTVSIGVASYQGSILDGKTLIQCADTALYQAKNNGRNRVEIHVREEEIPRLTS